MVLLHVLKILYMPHMVFNRVVAHHVIFDFGRDVIGAYELIVEGQFGLPFAGRRFSPPRAIGLQTLVQFTAPLFVRAALKRQVSLRANEAALPEVESLPWRSQNIQTMRAIGEHRATLQAYCIHRCVLRCGRSHSGEEEPFQITTRGGSEAIGSKCGGSQKA